MVKRLIAGALLIAGLLSPHSAFANACASAGTGDANASGSWSSCGGTVPGIGDTASIASTHTITFTANQTIGTSPAEGTAVITLSSSGKVIVNTGVTVTVRGGITVSTSNNTWTHNAGSGLLFDASNATSPTNQQYEFRISVGHNSPGKLIVNGTANSRVTFDSQAGGGNFWINDGDGPWLQGGLVDAQYLTLNNCGDSSHRCIRTSPSGSGNTFSCLFCRFITTGGIGGTYNMSTTSNYRLEDSHFTGTTQSEAVKLENASGYVSGTRTFLRNSFDKLVQFFTPAGFTIDGNYFGEGFESTDGTWVSFQNNLLRLTSSHNSVIVRGATGPLFNLAYYDSTTEVNPHFWQAGLYTATVSSLMCESGATAGGTHEGDCILIDVPGSAKTLTITKTIVLPDGAGLTSGTIFSALGNVNVTIEAYRNTAVAGNQACLSVGETYAGHSGMVTRGDSNICYNASGNTGSIMWDSGSNDTKSDLITSTNLDYNCYSHLGTNYSQLEFSSGSPGAHDVSADPNFTDATRDLGAWSGSLGGTATAAAALTNLALMNSATEVAGYTPTAATVWIPAGFVPRSASLDGAGLAGVDCGALDVVLASGTASRASLIGVGR